MSGIQTAISIDRVGCGSYSYAELQAGVQTRNGKPGDSWMNLCTAFRRYCTLVKIDSMCVAEAKGALQGLRAVAALRICSMRRLVISLGLLLLQCRLGIADSNCGLPTGSQPINNEMWQSWHQRLSNQISTQDARDVCRLHHPPEHLMQRFIGVLMRSRPPLVCSAATVPRFHDSITNRTAAAAFGRSWALTQYMCVGRRNRVAVLWGLSHGALARHSLGLQLSPGSWHPRCLQPLLWPVQICHRWGRRYESPRNPLRGGHEGPAA